MYIKTRECIDSNLLSVQVYRWELVGDPQLDMSGDTRGPGGVAVLYKEELFDSVLCIRVCVCACVRVCVCGYKFKRRVS